MNENQQLDIKRLLTAFAKSPFSQTVRFGLTNAGSKNSSFYRTAGALSTIPVAAKTSLRMTRPDGCRRCHGQDDFT